MLGQKNDAKALAMSGNSLSKRAEIGSEFWDIPLSKTKNSIFPQDTSWYLSGRSALKSILADIQKKQSVKTASLPAWCCDSMITPFLDVGIKTVFYPVNVENGCLVQDIADIGDADILFVMDYFGYTGTVSGHGFQGIVIRDITHSIFSAEYSDADYYFGSLRKWTGFLTGGYAFGHDSCTLPEDHKYNEMRRSAMEAKSLYITGISERKDYLSMFSEAEDYLEHCSPAGAAQSDIQAAMFLDIEFIKRQRRKNSAVLLDAFKDIAVFREIKNTECPLFVPIMVPDGKRNELRRYLIGNEIYLPVHWPLSEYHDIDARSRQVYDNELSLVCDQRYTENDMERMIETIKKFSG